MVDSTEMTYIILGLTLLGMIWYVTNRGRANLAKAREDVGSEDFDPNQIGQRVDEVAREVSRIGNESREGQGPMTGQAVKVVIDFTDRATGLLRTSERVERATDPGAPDTP